MSLEPARVTGDLGGEAPWIRIETNRPFVLAVTVFTLTILLLPILFQPRLPAVVVFAALLLLAFGGFRFVILIGPARLLGSPWVAADESGISARNRRGIVRYEWDRVISVAWSLTGFGLARWTVVEVTPTLGDPDSPYGPINPDEVANLWFLSTKRRSEPIGREFLSVCAHYGSKTRLVVGRSPME
jgi:hypothetical protein